MCVHVRLRVCSSRRAAGSRYSRWRATRWPLSCSGCSRGRTKSSCSCHLVARGGRTPPAQQHRRPDRRRPLPVVGRLARLPHGRAGGWPASRQPRGGRRRRSRRGYGQPRRSRSLPGRSPNTNAQVKYAVDSTSPINEEYLLQPARTGGRVDLRNRLSYQEPSSTAAGRWSSGRLDRGPVAAGELTLQIVVCDAHMQALPAAS
jgi:hypothetical protein